MMTSSNEKGASRPLWIAASTVCILSIGGLSFTVASSSRGEERARVEQAAASLSQALADVSAEREAGRVEIRRLDHVRGEQFREIIGLRRELASLRAELDFAKAARAQSDAAEIARLDRAQQDLFEELVRVRREVVTAPPLLNSGIASSQEDPAIFALQTGSVEKPPQSEWHGPPVAPRNTTEEEARRPRTRAPRRASSTRSLTRPVESTQQSARHVRPKPNASRERALGPRPTLLPSALMLDGGAN